MAFTGDATPIKLQLKFANFAENLEPEPRYHVRRISFSVTVILPDEGSADEGVDYSKPLSEEDQEVLNWQARTENLQEPLEVRKELTDLSGRLCPYKKISLSFVDFVSDEDTQQQWTGDRPLASYRHDSFRSTMLTRHSAPDGQTDGQPELLFLHDGLGGDHSCLRWRSHDYMKLRLGEARKPFYKVFWLFQWDIVDLSSNIDSHDNATNHGKLGLRLSSLHQDSMKRPARSENYHGVRYRHCAKRHKSPWVAEMRQQRDRKKIWLGSYKTQEAAARAADAGYFYYNLNDKLNFRDSPQYLEPIPQVLNDVDKEKFVKGEAKRLGSLAETIPSTWDPDNRASYNTRTEIKFTSIQPRDTGNSTNYIAGNMQPTTTANFAGLPISDGVEPLMDSGSNPKTNLDAPPSTSCGSDLLQVIAGSSPEEDLWPTTPTGSFAANSQARAGVLYSPHERVDTYQDTLIPVGICSSEEATNIVFDNMYTSAPWGENLAPTNIPDNIPGAILGDVAGESPLCEIPSVEILGVSNNALRLPLEMERQTTYDSGQGAESVQAEPNDGWDYIDIYDHWLFQCNYVEDVTYQSQPNLPYQWCQR